MNSKQEAKLKAYHAALAHCEENAETTNKVPAFSDAINVLLAIVRMIMNVSKKQISSTIGITVKKKENKQLLADITEEIAGAIYAYAMDSSLTILKDLSKITAGHLMRSRDEEMVMKCDNILTIAQQNKAALITYGITDEVMKTMEDAFHNFAKALPSTRNAKTSKSTYLKTMNDLFKQADSILNIKMVKLSHKFKKVDKEFYNTFTSNRMIINRTSTVTQLKGMITDANNGNPLAGVLIEISETGTIAKSNGKGLFYFKPLAPGIYTFKITKEGYTTQVIVEVKITQGAVNKMEIKLK